MPPRSALFILALAVCAGVFYLLFRFAFGSEVGFWEVVASYWRKRKDAYYASKERSLGRELHDAEKEEVCSRCGKVAAIDPYTPLHVMRMYDRVCRQCSFELTGKPFRKGKK